MSNPSAVGFLRQTRQEIPPGNRLLPTAVALSVILVLAFWLRWTGMDWGLPQGEHTVASYRSDEKTLFSWMREMWPEKWDFNPHSYLNGTLLVFFLAGFYKILSFFDLLIISSDPLFYYRHVTEWAKFFWFGRLAMVIIGVSTVGVVYTAGRVAFGKGVGLLAALLYAIIPLHVVSSKHLLVEPAATLWFSLMLFFCFRIIRESLWRDYLGAAFVLASACVVKITGMPLWFLLFLSHLWGIPERGRSYSFWESLGSTKLWVSTTVALGSYFIFNPYFLSNLNEVWVEARNWYGQYHSWSYLGYGPLFSLTHLIPFGYGPWFAVWGLTATFFFFFSRRREIWLMLVGLLLFFYLNSRTGTTVVKYHVVLLPFLTLLVACFFKQLLEKMPLLVRAFSVLLFGWMVIETLELSLSYNRLFLRPDARDRASLWIEEHIPQGSKVAVLQEPYWYSPPILYNQYFFSGRSRYWRVVPKYQVVNLRYQDKRIKAHKPDYVVTSGREIRCFQRIRGDFRKIDDWDYWEAFLHQEGYEKVQTFENSLEKWGVKLPKGFPPDDWQQILAEVRIYRRGAPAKTLPILLG